VFDVTPALRHPIGRGLVLRGLGKMEARSAAVLRSLLADPRLSLVPGSRFATVKAVLGALRRTWAPLRILRAQWDPEQARAGVWAKIEGLLAAGETGGDDSPRARLAAIERMLVGGFAELFLTAMPVVAAGLMGCGG
jgi:hypothetical protein